MIGQRIPHALQQVFLASQKGKDVEKIRPPKEGTGFRVFSRTSSRKRRSAQPAKAPAVSSLNVERSGESAADATRKAMQAKKTKTKTRTDSPQAYLDRVIQMRGYSIKKYNSLEGGYYCRPTAHQQASYGITVSQAVKACDHKMLERMVHAGISPNPCNHFGESMVHKVCRKGDYNSLMVLLEAGCSLQVADDYGRTPLHDAFWKAEPTFETVQLILSQDKNLIHLLDCRGATPLSYVRKEHYKIWIEFLESKLDRFWPMRDAVTEGDERPPPLTMRPPHSMPIADPAHGLTLEVAVLVANGKMEPEEAMCLYEDSDSEDEEDEDDDNSNASDSESGYDSEETDFTMDELTEICLLAGGPMKVAERCFGGQTKGTRKTE